MLNTVFSVYSLLLAIGILLMGSGLLGTLLSLRADAEGFSNTVIGIIMSAFFVGYVIGAYTCPRLLRDVGYIRAFAVFAAVASAATLLHGLFINAYAWWILRAVSGICVVGLYMIIEGWLNSLIKTDPKRGRIFSVYMMTTLIAMGAGQFLLLTYGATELASFVLAAIFFILALVPIAVTRLSQPTLIAVPQMVLGKLVKRAPLGAMGAFVAGVISGAFWSLGALYAKGLGFDNKGIAAFLVCVIIGGVVLQYPIGHRSDLHDRRVVLMLVSFIACVLACVTYFIPPAHKLAFFTMALLYGGFSFSLYSISVAHTQDLIETELVMEATRTLLLFNGIGAATGPVIAGIVMHLAGSGALMLFFSIMLGLLGIFAVYRRAVTEPIPPEEQEAFIPMARTSPEIVDLDPRIETD